MIVNLETFWTSLFYLTIGLKLTSDVLGYESTCVRCESNHHCKPPECVCCGRDMPLPTDEVPQMVFFTFDDAVNTHIAGFYRQLFDSNRKNPNGCPISMTLFISHANTVYTLVREFYQKGMEIASHSVSHAHPSRATFRNEARKQKANLARMARIPSSKIKGWRSPFLEPLGDAQPNTLQSLGYAYDATLTVGRGFRGTKAPKPFTLDYGWPYECKIKPCPRRSHRGFWEVPVVSLTDYLGKYECVYVDGCNNPPPDEESAFNFLWENFLTYYKGNKAPFGINMHAAWFFHPDRLKAMDRFIQELVKLDDVYIVSVKQVIAWLQNPTSLRNIHSLDAWGCKQMNKNSSSAFHLRNTKIQQRIQEIERTNNEKQQKELRRQQQEWHQRQEASRRHASHNHQTSHRNNNPWQSRTQSSSVWSSAGRSVTVDKPRRSNFAWSSPAMSWQSLLAQYTKIQESKLQQKKARDKPQFTQAQIARERERKRKEQERIKEQQRLAKEKRRQREMAEIARQKQREQIQLQKEREILAKRKAEEKRIADELRAEKRRLAEEKRKQEELKRKQLEAERIKKEQQRKLAEQRRKEEELRRREEEQRRQQEEQRKLEMQRQLEEQRQREQQQRILNEQKLKKEQQRKAEEQKRNKITAVSNQPVVKSVITKIKGYERPVIEVTSVKRKSPGNNQTKIKVRKMQKTSSHKKHHRNLSAHLATSAEKQEVRLIGEPWKTWYSDGGNFKIREPWRTWIMQKNDVKDTTTSATTTSTSPSTQSSTVSSTTTLTTPTTVTEQPTTQPKEQTTQKTKVVEDLTAKITVRDSFHQIVLPSGVIIPKSGARRSKPRAMMKKPMTSPVPLTMTTMTPTTSTTLTTPTTPITITPETTTSTTTESTAMTTPIPLHTCKQEYNCMRPNCVCETQLLPEGLVSRQTPQLVYITIEGDVNFLSYSKMRSIFTRYRKNPNGCRISGTFFASDLGSSYRLANILKRDGVEIGLNGMRTTPYKNGLEVDLDIQGQLKSITDYTGITRSDIKGWRTPNMQAVGDGQFDALRNHTLYDSSLVSGRSALEVPKIFPFTLDFGWSEPCIEGTCPGNSYPGQWEVPVIPLMDMNESSTCKYADDCTVQPKTARETESYLMDNFNAYYLKNRAPFGIHLSQKWFYWIYNRNLSGLSRFIKNILRKKDVYIVSVSKMLDWMKNPVSLKSLQNSRELLC